MDLGVVVLEVAFDTRGKAPEFVFRAGVAVEVDLERLALFEDLAAVGQRPHGALAPFVIAGRQGNVGTMRMGFAGALVTLPDQGRARRQGLIDEALRRLAPLPGRIVKNGSSRRQVLLNDLLRRLELLPDRPQRRQLLGRRRLQRLDQRLTVVRQQHNVVAGAGELHVEHRLVGRRAPVRVEHRDHPVAGQALGRVHGRGVGVVQMVQLRVVTPHGDLTPVLSLYPDVHRADGEHLGVLAVDQTARGVVAGPAHLVAGPQNH